MNLFDDDDSSKENFDAASVSSARKWDHFYDKYQSEGEETFMGVGMVREILEDFSGSSGEGTASSLTMEDEFLYPPGQKPNINAEQRRELITHIETTLKSNLKKLMLEKEKLTLFLDMKRVRSKKRMLLKELRRLLKIVNEDDLMNYCIISLSPKRSMIDKFKGTYNALMQEILYQRYKESAQRKSKGPCHRKFTEEWERLIRLAPEEEVLLYTLHVGRAVCLQLNEEGFQLESA